MYGDITHRSVVGMTAGTPTPMHGAHVSAGAALQNADAEKTRMYDEALRGRPGTAAILAIEAGGRMHRDFYRLLDTFAMLKADADAGPLDDNTDPAKAKFHKTVFARTKYALMGRIQVARVKCVAERMCSSPARTQGVPPRGAPAARTPARTPGTPLVRKTHASQRRGAEDDDGLMTVKLVIVTRIKFPERPDAATHNNQAHGRIFSPLASPSRADLGSLPAISDRG